MKVKYINPFIESVTNFFDTMLDTEISMGDISISLGDVDGREFTAVIGLGGPITGTVSMSFPVHTALKVCSKLLKKNIKVVDFIVADALAEALNIIAGAAKTKLPRTGDKPIDLSIPAVVRGRDYSLYFPSQAMWLEVPFQSDIGEFSLRVTIQDFGEEEQEEEEEEGKQLR